jgi:membrane-associated phospholipid phosphatase
MQRDAREAGVTPETQTQLPQHIGLSDRLAHIVTEALAPAVLVAGISVAVAWHSRSPLWGIITAVFASGIPISYILRGVRRGHYSDHHVRVRERRPAVLLFAAASVVAGLVLMMVFHAPRELVALVVAMLAGLALTLAVTHWWKVSFHAAVASGTATTLVLVFGPWLCLAWPFVVLVTWSRVALRDHTVAQVVVGAILGALAAGLVFPLLR